MEMLLQGAQEERKPCSCRNKCICRYMCFINISHLMKANEKINENAHHSDWYNRYLSVFFLITVYRRSSLISQGFIYIGFFTKPHLPFQWNNLLYTLNLLLAFWLCETSMDRLDVLQFTDPLVINAH